MINHMQLRVLPTAEATPYDFPITPLAIIHKKLKYKVTYIRNSLGYFKMIIFFNPK